MKSTQAYNDLINAVKSGDKSQVEELLKNHNYDDREKKNALNLAKQMGFTEIAELLEQYIAKEKAQEQMQENESEPREYHEHINEKYVAAMKAREKEQAKEKKIKKEHDYEIEI